MTKNYSNKTKRGIRRAAVKVNVKMRNRPHEVYSNEVFLCNSDVCKKTTIVKL